LAALGDATKKNDPTSVALPKVAKESNHLALSLALLPTNVLH